MNYMNTYFRLMIGLCLPAWFLSMFIMNTAVLAMMLVIMISLLDKMEEVITRLGMPDDGKLFLSIEPPI